MGRQMQPLVDADFEILFRLRDWNDRTGMAAKPMNLGAADRTEHSQRLRKMAARGVVSIRKAPSMDGRGTGSRQPNRYRITPEGRVALLNWEARRVDRGS